ncbi:uncharacterized protein LOC129005021 [Macrosteles quadrilineatus]|uniref:uncharacterized protein LOC129005021 n=1 Tax=Macrosteles quadrilineatus TaxID=74068 RepID=UPI0023E2F451|nr:uncharacterized protein LOC129005021 [Macrosteles quadrilineatus]
MKTKIANDFNKFFTSVGSKLANSINAAGAPVVNDADFSLDTNFTFNTVTHADIERYVQGLRGGSAPGHDDLKKAFDSVDRSRLLRKLELVGVRGTSLAWFSSYLSDRLQTVALGEVSSDVLPVEYGVVQGMKIEDLRHKK